METAAIPPEPSPARPELDMAAIARTSALLSIEAGAATLAVTSLLLGRYLAPTLDVNQYPPQIRSRIVAVLLAMMAAPVLAVVVAALRRKERALDRAGSIARLAAPLVPLSALPSLLQTGFWFRKPLDFLLLLVVFALLSERCLRLAFGEVDAMTWQRGRSLAARLSRSDRAPLVVVVLASTAYVVYTSYLTILDHYRFGTGAFDLAIFDNMMWNALHGKPFRSTVMFGLRPGNALVDHAHFAMMFFVPLYALWPRAESLLVWQAAMLGFAAVPLFLFARTQISTWAAATVALCYLAYPPLHGAQFYDFHWLPLAVFPHFLLFYAIAARRPWLTAATVVFLFVLREDIAPGIAVVGLFLLVTGARARTGAVLLASATVWFALVKFVIMPWIGEWWFSDMYSALIAPGEKGFGSIFKTLLVNPIYVLRTLLTEPKLEYVLQLLAPLALIPLRRPALSLLCLPGFFFTLLTSWGPAFSIRYQYTTHWIAYLFAATVLYLGMLERRTRGSDAADAAVARRDGRAALGAVVLAMLVDSAVFGVVLVPSSFVGANVPIQFSMSIVEREHYRQLRALIARIPEDASVSATDIEAPHLSNRMDLFAVAQDDTAGQYLLLNPDSFHLARTKQNVTAILGRFKWRLVAREGRMFLFARGEPSPETERALRDVRRLLRR